MRASSSSSGAPLVSVLTPSFNQARWLADNVGSVAGQTYGDVEHIVVDGGSTDGSVELLQRSAAPGLRWVSEPDRGQSHAINKALAMSRGEILGWLNSDDAYFSPTVIEEAVRLFVARPGVSVVFGHAALVNGDGLVLQTIWAPPFSYRLLRLHDFIVQPAAFVRRSAVGDALVDESYDFAMDFELWLRLGRAGRFARLDRIVALDRHQPGRKSYAMADIGRADARRLRAAYGIHLGLLANAARKAWKVATRLAGISLLREAHRVPLAFAGRRDSVPQLALRQTVIPRSRMPR